MNYMAENLKDVLGKSTKAMQTIDAYISFSEKLSFDSVEIETILAGSPNNGFGYAKSEFLESVNRLVHSEYDNLRELAVRLDMEINDIIGEYGWNTFSDKELLPLLCESWLLADVLSASYKTNAPSLLQSIRRLRVMGKNEFYICLTADRKNLSVCQSLTMGFPNSATDEEIANISVVASSIYKELSKTNPDLYLKINGYHDSFNSKISFVDENGENGRWKVKHVSNSTKTKTSKDKTSKNTPANQADTSLEEIFGEIVRFNEVLRVKKWEKSLITR